VTSNFEKKKKSDNMELG